MSNIDINAIIKQVTEEICKATGTINTGTNAGRPSKC